MPVRSKEEMFGTAKAPDAGAPKASADSLKNKDLTPLDLVTYDGPLYIQNLTNTKISHDDTKGNTMTLGPVDSDTAFAILPKAVAQHPGIQKLWRIGRIRVSTDPEMEEVLKLADAAAIRRETQADPLGSVEESSSKNDLKEVSCLECNTKVFKSEKDLEQDPPLCDVHEANRGMYLIQDGEWTKVGVES